MTEATVWIQRALTRISSETRKHAVRHTQAFSTIRDWSNSIETRAQFRSQKLVHYILPAVGVDTTRDNEGVCPEVVIQRVLDSFASFPAEEKVGYLVEISS